MPAFDILTEPPDTTLGYHALMLGYFAVPMVGRSESLFLCCAWFANVAIAVALLGLLSREVMLAFFGAFAALVLSASFALVRQTFMQGMCVPHVIALRAGYFVWVLSALLIFASSAVSLWRNENGQLMARRRGSISGAMMFAVAYLLMGLLLPAGECSLIQS